MAKKISPAGELASLLIALLPPDEDYVPVVPKEKQEKMLAILDENVHNESFYFVFNLQNCVFDCVRGTEKWLGYSSKEFTVQQYLQSVHSGQAVQFNAIAHSMYKILCNGIFRLQFATQRYISLLALKHYSGEYILFKKTTSVFQYDTKNRLLQQLNEFTKIGLYRASPLDPRVTEIAGMQRGDFERIVYEMTLKSFMDKKYFSPREFDVLKCYAQNETISNQELADKLKIVRTTAEVLNRHILQKAKRTFTHPFHDAREVAAYLKREKIL